MSSTRHVAAVSVGALLASGGLPVTLTAQSASDLGAWNGLMLSPVGALPPLAREPADGASGRNELAFRYGRWKYDLDDAIHNDLGLTLSHRLGFASTEVALTGAYLSLSCGTCASWVLGGVDAQMTLWHRALAGAQGRNLSGSLALRAGVGGARFLGPGHSMAGSAAAAIAVGVGVPFIRKSRLCASLVPGFGFGGIASPDETANGSRPTLGGALAWNFASGLVVDLGIQRIIISGGPALVGTGLSWRGL